MGNFEDGGLRGLCELLVSLAGEALVRPEPQFFPNASLVDHHHHQLLPALIIVDLAFCRGCSVSRIGVSTQEI